MCYFVSLKQLMYKGWSEDCLAYLKNKHSGVAWSLKVAKMSWASVWYIGTLLVTPGAMHALSMQAGAKGLQVPWHWYYKMAPSTAKYQCFHSSTSYCNTFQLCHQEAGKHRFLLYAKQCFWYSFTLFRLICKIRVRHFLRSIIVI